MKISEDHDVEPSDKNWTNIDESCALCEMKKMTKWYYEDEDIIISDTLSGHPFVVQKHHNKTSEEGLIQHAHTVVEELFGSHTFNTRMNMFPNHFHTHIVLDEGNTEHLTKE
jgi:hypothetical protein